MSDRRRLPVRLELDAAEAEELRFAVSAALREEVVVGDVRFAEESPILARALPERLVRFLANFRNRESDGACLISGMAVDDQRIGPTPLHWRAQADPSVTAREELLLALLASLLGDIFGWGSLQDGRLVQDLLPIRSEENQKSGNSSKSLLDLHVEDAFHFHRADYLGLMCLRNCDAVPTTYADVASVELSAEDRSVLSQHRFRILPDDTHVTGASSTQVPAGSPKVPVLFGDVDEPYLRVDGYFMEVDDGDAEAADALAALLSGLEEVSSDIVLAPGEILFIDNYRAVHGRKPFHARYDGNDRWLKRVNVTRDLRKSRAVRDGATSRTVL